MKLPPAFVKDDKTLVNVVIETPKGSRNKFAFDEASWLFRMTKTLPLGLAFPLDFGFIPHTKCEDGDPMDALVAIGQPTYPGCVLECRVVGIIEGEQTEKHETFRNDRLVVVPDISIEYADTKHVKDLGKEFLKDLEQFFVHYNAMQGRKYKLLHTKGPDEAMKAIKKAMK